MNRTQLSRRDLLKGAGALALAGGTLGALSAQAAADPATDHTFSLTKHRQLFLDDLGIAKIENLQRTLHQPEKRGAVVRSSNPAKTIQTRSAPFWDSEAKVFKLWVLGTDDELRLSEDGLHWTAGPKPSMGRLDLVVYDPNDPDPARRFKAAIINDGFAVSPDGIQWTKLDVPKIESSDEANFSFDPRSGLFIHTVKRGGQYGRAVAIATSQDFKTWKDYGVVFHADDLDQEIGRRRIAERLANPSLKQTEYNVPEHYSVQIYNMGVFWYEGLYIGLPSMYHHTGLVPKEWPGFDKLRLSPYILDCVKRYGDYTGFYNVQLTTSRDLVHWQRFADRPTFLETSPLGAGANDLQTIIGPSSPLVRNDELWFYYTGIKQYAFVTSGNEPGYDDYLPDRGAICLAVLRRDGFASLDAGDQAGTVLTKPFVMPAGELHVNANSSSGSLSVSVVDESGQPIKGFEQSQAIASDTPDAIVSWGETKLDQLRDRTVQLSFALQNSKLYSYWF